MTNLPCSVILVIQYPSFVEEELSEPDGNSLAEDFDLKENSLL